MAFSVLQSVYIKDEPLFLDQSLESIYCQTLKPDVVIIVKDGQITKDLEVVLAKWTEKLPLKVVGYEQNHGLSYALNYGLQFVETELVCRMDSDDICVANRFEKQIKYMENNQNVALCSGYITEFLEDPNEIVSIRTVPIEKEKIKERLKIRNAFNHVTVCFRKSAVLAVGGYQNSPYFEDYDLWTRIVQNGYDFANIPEVLVNVRIGNDMIGRRLGWKYAGHEYHFFKKLLDRKFINHAEFMRNIITRIPLRLLPKKMLEWVYMGLHKRGLFSYDRKHLYILISKNK